MNTLTCVKALLPVMYGKYSTRGGMEWQIQHKAKPSAVFDTRPHPEYCIFHTSPENRALSIQLYYCFALGGLAVVVQWIWTDVYK